MKREYIAKGKTIDAAIDAAAMELGVDRDELSIEILETPFKGFLGIGSTPAIVKATVGEDDIIGEIGLRIDLGEKRSERPVPAKPKTQKTSEKRNDKKPQHKEKHVKKVVTETPFPEETGENDPSTQQAKAFIEDVIKLMGITEYNIKTGLAGKTIKIAVTGKDMGALIGKRGETMYAIQYLCSLAVNKQDEGQYARIELDVENYRSKRTAALEKLALRMAEKVVKNRKNMTLEAMQSYERRVIHAVLQDYKGVTTRSIGEEPFRKVVICYDRDKK